MWQYLAIGIFFTACCFTLAQRLNDKESTTFDRMFFMLLTCGFGTGAGYMFNIYLTHLLHK